MFTDATFLVHLENKLREQIKELLGSVNSLIEIEPSFSNTYGNLEDALREVLKK